LFIPFLSFWDNLCFTSPLSLFFAWSFAFERALFPASLKNLSLLILTPSLPALIPYFERFFSKVLKPFFETSLATFFAALLSPCFEALLIPCLAPALIPCLTPALIP